MCNTLFITTCIRQYSSSFYDYYYNNSVKFRPRLQSRPVLSAGVDRRRSGAAPDPDPV